MDLIATLRGPKGCPWDKKQTPQSIGVYLLEEVYELLDAIESNDMDAICEELGDVLFQVLFMTTLFREKGYFDLEKVASMNREKMVRRHPHVFNGESIKTVSAVKERWQEIKKSETKGQNQSMLDSIPPKLPALLRAYRMSERVGQAGFDWEDIDGVMAKAREEWLEFEAEVKGKDSHEINKRQASLELGDILFTLVNVARFAKIHPERALLGSNQKFEKRFRRLEGMCREKGRSMDSLTMEELETMWSRCKSDLDR